MRKIGFRLTRDPVVQLPVTISFIEEEVQLGQLLVIHILQVLGCE